MRNKKKSGPKRVPVSVRPVESRFLRGLLIFTGTLSVALGVIGIFLPILPTTPFLLLAAWCYARSSQRFYDWLMGNKWFGEYIRNYQEGRGVPVRVKALSITFLWLTITISALFFVSELWIQAVLFAIAIGVTIHLVTLKTLKPELKGENK